MILSLVALQTGRVDDPGARREVGELAARALGIIHEQLDCSEATTVALATYLRELCDHLARFHAGLGVELTLTVDADPITMGEDETVTLGLIINELVAGAAEHAFPDGRGAIHVELRHDAHDGRAQLTVSDDGRDTTADRRGDLGHRLVAALAAHLGGEMVIASSPRRRTRVTIAFSPERIVWSEPRSPG
jgi:two-component sensor histidine kinase